MLLLWFLKGIYKSAHCQAFIYKMTNAGLKYFAAFYDNTYGNWIFLPLPDKYKKIVDTKLSLAY
jgi:hypothetical protein